MRAAEMPWASHQRPSAFTQLPRRQTRGFSQVAHISCQGKTCETPQKHSKALEKLQISMEFYGFHATVMDLLASKGWRATRVKICGVLVIGGTAPIPSMSACASS